jgi:hypothetical protein
VVSEQRLRRGQVCDGGRHEVKKSRDIGLNPLLNLDYLTRFGRLARSGVTMTLGSGCRTSAGPEDRARDMA